MRGRIFVGAAALNLTDAGFLDITGFEEAGAALRVGLRTALGG
ncbi:MAG: hypothetical protein RQ745_05490 [Longimicrobiales bacterium]|nr:hypothetical protein [Longimicrobiales bacterium]